MYRIYYNMKFTSWGQSNVESILDNRFTKDMDLFDIYNFDSMIQNKDTFITDWVGEPAAWAGDLAQEAVW